MLKNVKFYNYFNFQFFILRNKAHGDSEKTGESYLTGATEENKIKITIKIKSIPISSWFGKNQTALHFQQPTKQQFWQYLRRYAVPVN